MIKVPADSILLPKPAIRDDKCTQLGPSMLPGGFRHLFQHDSRMLKLQAIWKALRQNPAVVQKPNGLLIQVVKKPFKVGAKKNYLGAAYNPQPG
jgi:hypothetical protein